MQCENCLCLEPLADSHIDGFGDLWADEKVIKFTNIKKPCSRGEVEARLGILLDNQKTLNVPAIFTIFYRGDICGMAGCPVMDEAKGEFGFFYQICSNRWGKGIGSASAAWVLSYMRSCYQEFTLFADVVNANKASVRILDKLGFVETGRHERAFERNGETWDVVDYILTQGKNTHGYDS